MNDKALADLGTLDLKLERLQIWVYGRRFPDLHDYWDGNWLHVTAHWHVIASITGL
jgi:DNA-binding ferritin-like protein